MPDADRPRESTDAPPDWSAAFAALPQAEPPQGGWDRLAPRLPVQPRSTQAGSGPRAKWPVWLATAASLALAAAVPLALIDGAPDSGPSPSPPLPAAESVARTSTTVEEQDPMPPSVAVERDPAGSDPQPQSRAASVAPAQAPSLAGRAPASSTVADGVHPDTASDTPSPHTRLAHIQQESARLEALLALAQDDRVGSGTGAILAAQMQSRLSQIDSVLASDAIDDDERLALWDARVETLRDLTGLETTERWFAAEGRTYDTALVQVH